MLLTIEHIKTLDQWHSTVNSIILKRTWETAPDIISGLKSFVKATVSDVRRAYGEYQWAQSDPKFLFLQA